MSDKDDGVGGLILLGLGLLVVGSLLGGSKKKKVEPPAVVAEEPPTVKPPVQSIRCSVPGCTGSDVRPCHFCGKYICRDHTEGCVCTGPYEPWTCGCHKNGPSYCQSCD
jgi:hypothetical protein